MLLLPPLRIGMMVMGCLVYCWMEHAFPSLGGRGASAHSILLQSGRRFNFSG
jgi:hypothetical protein